jgi:hypothetical protein
MRCDPDAGSVFYMRAAGIGAPCNYFPAGFCPRGVPDGPDCHFFTDSGAYVTGSCVGSP